MSVELDPFVGIYFSIGETTILLPETVQNIVSERIYKIVKVTPNQYTIDMTDVTGGFSIRFLCYKVGNQLVSGTTGNGIDQILFENGELVALFSVNESGTKLNGRYVLKCKN